MIIKRSFLFLVIQILVYQYAWAQDLIVTKANDSINCKINSVNQNQIYFNFYDGIAIRDTMLTKDQVNTFARSFYDHKIENPKKKIDNNSFKDFRLAISGGYARIIFYEDFDNESLESYLEDIKNGYQISASIVRFYREKWGIGLKYNQFRSSSKEIKVTVHYGEGDSEIGGMKDDITIHYFGPCINYRWTINEKYSWHSSASIGYIRYVNDYKLIDDYTLAAETFGSSFTLGWDHNITDNLAIGTEIGVVLGIFNKYRIDDGNNSDTFTLDDYFTTSHFDISIGLRFNL